MSWNHDDVDAKADMEIMKSEFSTTAACGSSSTFFVGIGDKLESRAIFY